MEPKQTLSLCVACGACPSVELYEDSVRIGEDESWVTLKREEWNALVEAIRQGTLSTL